MKKHFIAIALFSFFSYGVFGQITSSASLIEKMHQEYVGKWYPNLTFEQKTTYFQDGEVSKKELWYEAIKIPEWLIIKIGSMDSGSGLVFQHDSMFLYTDGEMVNSTPRVHDLLVLGFSVYFDSPETTLKKLEASGYDLSFFSVTESHYIIGNTSIKRAWIEKDRLIFIKSETINTDGSISKVEFNKYEKLGGGWIAPEVIFYRADKMTLKEEYQNVETPEDLNVQLGKKKFSEIQWNN